MGTIIRAAEQIDFTTEELPTMPPPNKVVMVSPDYFDVEYVINPHMVDQAGKVDRYKAQREWSELVEGFRSTGYEVDILEGQPGLPDLVFCSNLALPFVEEDGRLKVVMSRMRKPQRRNEVVHLESWFHRNGYEVLHLDSEGDTIFEGTGDAVWHPGRRLLWGGYGVRSEIEAHEEIAAALDITIIPLELIDETFYHLDTCFCALDEKSVLIYPGAIKPEGLELIHSVFDRILEVPEDEAKQFLAANATCPNGKDVLIQKGAAETTRKLLDHGFVVHEFHTDEFLKSGGSVYCMKLLVW